MSKITVIQLLNKIANGEEVPDAIKWGCHDFEWFVYEYKAKGELGEPTLLDYLAQCPHMLNDKIEIIEEEPQEHKIPEKLYHCCMETNDKETEFLIQNINDMSDKINEIIDYLDYLKSKGDE